MGELGSFESRYGAANYNPLSVTLVRGEGFMSGMRMAAAISTGWVNGADQEALRPAPPMSSQQTARANHQIKEIKYPPECVRA